MRKTEGGRQSRRTRLPATLLWVTFVVVGAVLYPHLPTNGIAPASVSGISIVRAFPLCGSGARWNCVVDGDTIWLDGTKIRLEDIDAPEVFSPKCESEAALGRRATERLVQLMNDGPVEVTLTGARDADVYGRKLRTLHRDGRSLGATLVNEGLARRWDGARHSWCR